MGEYHFNLTAAVPDPPRVRGKFVVYRDRLESALSALNAQYASRAEDDLRAQYAPHFTDTWSSETTDSYPQFSFVVQSDSPYIHFLDVNTGPGYWPPYSGPTKRQPDRPPTRLWDWLQRERGYPAIPASAWVVARAIFRRGTYGGYRLEPAYYRLVRSYAAAFSRTVAQVLFDVTGEGD